MAHTFSGFLRLPLELQTEVLWHCLVTPEPVVLAYSGLRLAVGGQFLVKDPRFFCILQTCHLVRHLGRRLFLQHNTFVFGDVFFVSGRLQDARRYSRWLWIDDRTCSHPVGQFCSHIKLEATILGSQCSGVNVSETLGFWLDPSTLGHIRHLIIVDRHRYNESQDEPILAQILLFVERLIRAGSRLASLFIFAEQRLNTPSSPPLVGDPGLDVLGPMWHLLPGLAMLCERSPGLHMHISHFGHGDEQLHANPFGPLLCADTAASARSYLSAHALDGGVDGGRLPPGLSLSSITPDPTFDTSADGRYLLEFGRTESYTLGIPDSMGAWLDIVRKKELRRSHLWHDPRDLLEPETVWFRYNLMDAGGDGQSALSMLRIMSADMQLQLGAYPPGAWRQWAPVSIFERLLDLDRPCNEYIELEGDDLRAVVADWASLGLKDASDMDSERENEQLRCFFMRKVVFDEGAAYGQQRITDFFRPAYRT